jgi:hypothetical protein
MAKRKHTTLQDDIRKACGAYLDFCRLSKNKHKDSIGIEALIAYFHSKDISTLKKDGTENSFQGVRLGLNKYIGKVKDVGVHEGKWSSDAEADAYMAERFKKITSPPTISGGLPDWD